MIVRNLLAAVAVLGTFGVAMAQSTGGIPAYRPGVSDAIAFPDRQGATRPEGVFVPPRAVAMVTPGLTKDQVYALLGVPHFHEGLFGVRRWNYILNFYTGEGDKSDACQYQINFDRRARVESTWFQNQACGNILERQMTAAKSSTAQD